MRLQEVGERAVAERFLLERRIHAQHLGLHSGTGNPVDVPGLTQLECASEEDVAARWSAGFAVPAPGEAAFFVAGVDLAAFGPRSGPLEDAFVVDCGDVEVSVLELSRSSRSI